MINYLSQHWLHLLAASPLIALVVSIMVDFWSEILLFFIGSAVICLILWGVAGLFS